jgi:molybdopterin-containing oxidoreductase family iron-sulfur binding subunit
MAKYGMAIDLKRCYGCYACVMACKAENFTPPGVFWARLLKGETGEFPNTVRQALPVLCMHCDDPSCLTVCPTKATYPTKCDFCKTRRDSGEMEPSCVRACPALARTFGDLDDPNSEISVKVRRGRAYVLNPELGNKPKVHYIPPR